VQPNSEFKTGHGHRLSGLFERCEGAINVKAYSVRSHANGFVVEVSAFKKLDQYALRITIAEVES